MRPPLSFFCVDAIEAYEKQWDKYKFLAQQFSQAQED